jgi:hypothetical protein
MKQAPGLTSGSLPLRHRVATRPHVTEGEHPMQACLNCRRDTLARPRRGLCRRCHADPAILARFPCLGDLAGRATRDPPHPTGPPPAPVTAEPGSPAKLAEMAARVASGFTPTHPADTVLPPHLAGEGSRRRLNKKLGELAEALALSTLAIAQDAVR